MDASLILASGEASFFDETFLYISGGLLVALALGTAFLGMRKDDFPSDTQFKGMTAVAMVLVVCTGFGAIQSARFEQAERREKNEEAAKEAQVEEGGKLEQEAPLGEGEGAEPGTSTGGAEPGGEPQGDAGGKGEPKVSVEEGRALFIDTGCNACHTLDDAGSEAVIGPVLDDVLPGQSPEMIRTSIIDPGAEISDGFPENTMPSDYATVLNEVELDTLVAYLETVAGK